MFYIFFEGVKCFACISRWTHTHLILTTAVDNRCCQRPLLEVKDSRFEKMMRLALIYMAQEVWCFAFILNSIYLQLYMMTETSLLQGRSWM